MDLTKKSSINVFTAPVQVNTHRLRPGFECCVDTHDDKINILETSIWPLIMQFNSKYKLNDLKLKDRYHILALYI